MRLMGSALPVTVTLSASVMTVFTPLKAGMGCGAPVDTIGVGDLTSKAICALCSFSQFLTSSLVAATLRGKRNAIKPLPEPIE